jgi:hypothetical protein
MLLVRTFATLSRRLALPLLAVLISSGCAHRHGPNKLPIIVDKKELKAIKDLIADYRANPDHVTQQTRNDLVERLIGVSDDHYISLRNGLLNSRNAVGFVGEVTATTLSAVSALLGDVDTKSILSAASALTTSTKVSLDKNFFNNTSTQAIVAQMDALRAERLKDITDGESVALSTYGLEVALNDVRKYDDAGTIQSALLSLNSNANVKKNTAEDALTRAKARRARVRDE